MNSALRDHYTTEKRWNFSNVVYCGSNPSMEATPTTQTASSSTNANTMMDTSSTTAPYYLYLEEKNSSTNNATTSASNPNKRGCKELQAVKRRRLSERSEMKIIPMLVPKKESNNSQGCWKQSPTSPTVFLSQKFQYL